MIDQKRQLFPLCIVWTVLPCFTWFIPWIGHAAICEYTQQYCSSKGTIYQFLGYHINAGNSVFGSVIKYIRIYPESDEQYDGAIMKSNQKFLNQNHHICCNNCHHHVADALNQMKYKGKNNWTQFDIWWMCLWNSNYVNWCSILKVYLPLVIMLAIILGIVYGVKS